MSTNKPYKAIICFVFGMLAFNKAALSSDYKKNYYSLRPGMTPHEMEMHSIVTSHPYCKQNGDEETVWRNDGAYKFEYDYRGILTGTTWFLRHKIGYISEKKFKSMARNSFCMGHKPYRFDITIITAMKRLYFLYRRKAMYAVQKGDYLIYYTLMPNVATGKGYHLFCEKRGKVNSSVIPEICAISKIFCPYDREQMMGISGGSRF